MRRRLTATLVGTLVAGAAAAAPAHAKDGSTRFGENTVSIGNVVFAPKSAIAVDVTYSCEPPQSKGWEPHLGVVWRLADKRDSNVRSPRGGAQVNFPQLICDKKPHSVKVNAPAMWPEDSLPFGKGDPVQVTALLSPPEGAPLAEFVKVSTL
ncbi:hypothetical protein ABZ924_13530 [Streptomyces sp. NPDC046876]|uniref:hypothetical protein n=1 Tax=Streptomyces sp. NPDC046876 TaxID=3155616 RepID=UPI0033F084C3